MQRQETELRLLPALSDPMHLSGWKKREKQKVRCCSLRGRTTNAFRVVERGDRLLQLLREASTITFLPPHIMNELKALESEVCSRHSQAAFESPLLQPLPVHSTRPAGSIAFA